MLTAGHLALWVFSSLATAAGGNAMWFDFERPAAIEAWQPVNDVVMGGRSSGRLAPTARGTAVFAGRVSLADGGGFASVRSKPAPMPTRGHRGVVLRVLGDGQTYKLNLKMDGYLDGVLYRVAFETEADRWQTLFFPFDAFQPTFRGRRLTGVEPLDPARIVSVGLMIADRQEGEFRLELSWIGAGDRGLSD